MIQRIFDKEISNYKVLFYSNALDCIDFLNVIIQDNSLPTLFILDIKLINSSGLGILKYIKENSKLKHLPVIMFSSSARFDDKLQAKRLGCNEYVEKPKNYLDLKNKIPKIVHTWSN